MASALHTTSSPRLTELGFKFRDTKLAALKADPGSFVQRYDLEVLQPVSVWQAHLARQITILACVVVEDACLSPEDALLNNEWAGFAAIRGPMTMEDYYPLPDIGQPLWEGQLNVATEDTRGMNKQRARMRLFVNPKTTWLVAAYRQGGFQDSGMVTLREGFIANGMDESIPSDTTSTPELRVQWETRYGLAMEKIIEIVQSLGDRAGGLATLTAI
ncbi:hypothetical protein EK21DRAFT_96910 [Setomelanomma holmii]|uniref:Uncharacterized protein n=1 Tax=Setomelanomma holmii TaxID=210430 RepID=A0A9P4LS57_9PLEO|nr:hypothetical protein EK21DRAFT_96910 [Setomelanomma holmii]